MPGIETRQNGALRSNDQIPLETSHYQQPTSSTHAHHINRSNHDNASPIQQQQQQKNGWNSISGGGRRVAPGKAFEENNS